MLSRKDARQAVRLTTERFDSELDALQEAAVADLMTAGVAEQDDDALYEQALRMYLKGNFEPNAPEAQACRSIYEGIKIQMKLTDRYREGEADA